MKQFDLSLYLVLDRGLCGTWGMVETVRAAVAGGVTMVQLRDKTASLHEMIATGRALKHVLAGTGVPLIVNDRVEVVLAIDAEGMHIGQDDGEPAIVRQQIGPDRILGISAGTVAHISAVDPALVDYIGVGPVFPTDTKPGHAPAIGMDGLEQRITLTGLPTVAIGGLKVQHADDVIAAGADGMAVVSAICGMPDPQAAAHALSEAVRKARS